MGRAMKSRKLTLMSIAQAALSIAVDPNAAHTSVTLPWRPVPSNSRTTMAEPIRAAAVARGPSSSIAAIMSEHTNHAREVVERADAPHVDAQAGVREDEPPTSSVTLRVRPSKFRWDVCVAECTKIIRRTHFLGAAALVRREMGEGVRVEIAPDFIEQGELLRLVRRKEVI